MSVTTNAAVSGDFSTTVTKLSATSAKWVFVPNPSATSSILHYTVAGQVQQNVFMTQNGVNWEYTVNTLSAGATVTYFFTYNLTGQPAKDSASFTYTQQ